MSKLGPKTAKALTDPRLEEPRDIDDRAPEPIVPAHRAAVEAGLADMRAGRIATQAEIDEVYARFGLRAR